MEKLKPGTYIFVRRTITVEDRIPFDQLHYPDCPTPQAAVDYERELELPEKIESFIAILEDAEYGLGEVISIETYGDIKARIDVSEVITIENIWSY